MDLQSKLKRVPQLFPQESLNILFVFHLSLAESAKYLKQSLFGETTFSIESTEVCLKEDGLFAIEDWRTISACYLSYCYADSYLNLVGSDGNLVCPIVWQNPRAFTLLPAPVWIVCALNLNMHRQLTPYSLQCACG
jgi:hypothetical protein